MERHGHLSLPVAVREALLKISAAIADRLLKLCRQQQAQLHGLSTTKPGALLKRQIQIRTYAD